MTDRTPATVVVLAAGEGKRMKSALPKVMHEVSGLPLIAHVLRALAPLELGRTVVVIGHGRDQVRDYLAAEWPEVQTAVQEEQLGTGHAALVGLDDPTDGRVLVLPGDVPLVTTATLLELLAAPAPVVALTAELADPSGYGRIVRTAGEFSAIVEHRDATPEQLAIQEVNAGVYAFDARVLRDALGRVGRANSQGEQYLTDVIALARADGLPVIAIPATDPDEILGVNDRLQLADVAARHRDRLVAQWARVGVAFEDPRTTWLDVDVELEPDSSVLRNTALRGRTRVAAGACVGPDSTLCDVEVGRGARVRCTTAEGAVIGADAQVGPYTYLRPGTVLGAGSKAGAYVEIKASTVGDGSKVPHLSYVGDATIGVGTNIGAATVFVNYDGQEKHRTVVGDHVRIGSDTMLVAPVNIGDGAYTAAGSVIVEDVPPGAMAVARARQRSVLGWVKRKRPGSASAAAAAAAEGSSEGKAE